MKDNDFPVKVSLSFNMLSMELELPYEKVLNSIKYLGIELEKINFYDESKKLRSLLHNLGIPSNLKGYKYIIDAIYYTNVMGIKITNDIYVEISKKYNTSPNAVNHAISNAIKRGWDIAKLSTMEEVFGYTIKDKPTNTQFIIMLAEIT